MGWCAVGCWGSFWVPKYISCGCCRGSQLWWQFRLQSRWICTSWCPGTFWFARLNRQWFPGTNRSLFLSCTYKRRSMDHKISQWPEQVIFQFQRKYSHYLLWPQSPVLLEVYDNETYCNPGGNIQNMERKEGNLIGCNLYCADHPCYKTLTPQSMAVMWKFCPQRIFCESVYLWASHPSLNSLSQK